MKHNTQHIHTVVQRPIYYMTNLISVYEAT